MPRYAARRPGKVPAPGETFKPREVFGGIGALVPEKIAASTKISMTAKLCYGHLVRRAGQKDRCWPSIRDIAGHIGVEARQAMRALRELSEAGLIRPTSRKEATGRQTSNEYEFIWGLVLQEEGDTYDTLPPAKSDQGRMTNLTPTGVTNTTPLEVTNRNHHQRKNKERSSSPAESAVQRYSGPGSGSVFPPKADDDEPTRSEYASGREELKAIYLAKTGEHFAVSDLDAIESMLVAAGISWESFAADARGHSWGRITNPVGFLKNRAKNFRAMTLASMPPVTAAEAADRTYKCPFCDSRVRGEGVRLIDGKLVPCSCASPEYVSHQRERGVFSEEKPQ